jgi:hypothetical protein
MFFHKYERYSNIRELVLDEKYLQRQDCRKTSRNVLTGEWNVVGLQYASNNGLLVIVIHDTRKEQKHNKMTYSRNCFSDSRDNQLTVFIGRE